MHLAQADLARARERHRHALEIARATGARLEEARALEGLGRCAFKPFNSASACDAGHLLRQALQIYQALGVPDAARLSTELDAALAVQTATAP